MHRTKNITVPAWKWQGLVKRVKSLAATVDAQRHRIAQLEVDLEIARQGKDLPTNRENEADYIARYGYLPYG